MVHSRERGGTYLGPRQRSRRNIAIVRANDRGLLRNIASQARNCCSPETKCVLPWKKSVEFHVYGAMSKTLWCTKVRSMFVEIVSRWLIECSHAFDSTGFMFWIPVFRGEIKGIIRLISFIHFGEKGRVSVHTLKFRKVLDTLHRAGR